MVPMTRPRCSRRWLAPASAGSRTERRRRSVASETEAGVAAEELAVGGHAESSPARVRQLLRRHTAMHLYDESGAVSEGLAIYTLSDPRDARDVKYVGQTRSPRRRFLQHLNHAQLWLPDERPWWIKQPKLRPLYTWIRALYREDCRLPVMIVTAWAPTVTAARLIERACIFEHLALKSPLLNVEVEILRSQVPLL
jgi:hypothetical protein